MATICNMGAEIGATTSVFPFNSRMGDYLRATSRPAIASASETFAHNLTPDAGAKYDQVIEIDLNTLEPHINGPFTPDLATPLSKFKEAVVKNNWPAELKVISALDLFLIDRNTKTETGRFDWILHQLFLRGHGPLCVSR
jgi:aconitate hydratase